MCNSIKDLMNLKLSLRSIKAACDAAGWVYEDLTECTLFFLFVLFS